MEVESVTLFRRLIGDRILHYWRIINRINGNVKESVCYLTTFAIRYGKAKTVASGFTTIMGIGEFIVIDIPLGESAIKS